MYNTKLIQTYISLNKDERRMLKKYIIYKYVSIHKDLLNFYIFIDTRRNINKDTVSKQKAFEYLYKNKPYKDLVIRHLIWLCTQLMEEFIVIYQVQNNQQLKNEVLERFYYNKTLYPYSDVLLKDSIVELEKIQKKNSQFYLDKFNLNVRIYDMHARNKRGSDFNLNEILNALHVFSIVEVLKYGITAISIKNISKTEAYNPLLQPILDFLPQSVFIENKLVKIYYFSYKLNENDNELYFDELLYDLKHNEKLFTHKDLNELYRLIINFCIRQINKNNSKYRTILFDLYLYTIEKGYLLENNQITRFIFSNTVAIGIRLGELSKTQNFINKYKELIEPDYKTTTLAFNSAKLFYAKGENAKALKILMTNEFKDVLWNLNMKHLTLKIYYENKDFEMLKIQIKALKTYVSRKDNLGYHKNFFMQVCVNMRHLLKLEQKPQLIKKFKFNDDAPDVDWFNKQLQQLIANRKLV